MSGAMPTDVTIREVGPRDGLQAEAPLPPESRARMILALISAGVSHVEAVSFVSPNAVPAMASPREVLALIGHPAGVTLSALVPNLRGAELALEAEVDEITVTVAASPEYNARNVKMTVEQSIEAIRAICDLARPARTPVDAVVSCAFGSPYEGEIGTGELTALVAQLLDGGASAITLADTTGMATPRLVSEVLPATRAVVSRSAGDDTSIGLHMHETRGTGLVNCFAAMQEGVSRFDTSLGGLGGSPFADQARGNVSTEDLVALLDDAGVKTGIDLGRLIEASAMLEGLVGHRLESRVAYAGPRLDRR